MRPLISPLNLQQRLRKRVVAATLLTLLLFLLLLPTLLTQAIRYQVPRMGLGTVEIGNIDINLFRGKVLLEEVALYKSAARVFYLRRGELDLSTLSLFEQRFHIQSLSINGLAVTIHQDPGEPLQVAGIAVPESQPTTTAAPGMEEESGQWAFGIDAFNLRDSSLMVVHPQFSETVSLNAISLGALAMWRPDYITPLAVNVSLREGNLTVEAKSTPFSEAPLHQTTVSIANLPLDSFAELAKPTLAELAGTLSTQFNLQLKQQLDGRISVDQQGKLSLTGLALQNAKSVINQKAMLWDGSIKLSNMAQLATLTVKGNLTLSGTSLESEGKRDDGISLERLSLKELNLIGTSEISLAEVTIEGLQAEAVRAQSGITLHGLPTPASSNGPEPAPTTDKTVGTADTSKPFQFRVDHVKMSGNNRLTFDDKTVKPPFRHSFTLTSGDILGLDSRQPEQPTQIVLKGKDDFYTEFTVEGTAKPLAAQQPAIDLKVKLDNFDMPPTSPYLVQLMGYRIATGQLHTDSAMAIEKNMMKGEVRLTLSQAKFEPEDQARMQNLQAKTSIPLNTALSLLRDKDDNIKLKLPIEGRLDDPQFDLSNIINTALGKALKGASVSYLKLLLQPYGSLISVIQLAGDAAGHIQLDPMLFEPGSAMPNSDVVAYTEKISQLLTKKGVNLKICGFATTADLLVLSKGKVKAIPPAGHPPLEALAKQRAESIKSMLVKQYGVAAKQLFVCHPELDHAAEAKERVELSI